MIYNELSEFYSDDMIKKAVIKHDGKSYYLDAYENNIHVKTITFSDKSVYYVEDAAENYVSGIMELNE